MPEDEPTQQQTDAQANDADYYMMEYSIITTDDQGKAKLWFAGSELNHFPNNTTVIKNPEIRFEDNSKAQWQTNAKQGLVVGESQIVLDGDVQIQQVSAEKKQVKINTENLLISLEDKIASSDVRVTLQSDAGQVNATGMRLDFGNQTLKLLSNVDAKYIINE